MRSRASGLKNNSGSAVITGMVTALGAGLVAVLILQQSQLTEKQSRIPRVKSALVQTELKLRQALSSASSFEACPASPGTICLRAHVEDQFNKPVLGAACPDTNAGCGIKVENLLLTAGHATGKIVYEGTEVSVDSQAFDFTVPADILISTTNCPPATPILTGWTSAGLPLCQALPPKCGPGQYISELKVQELQRGTDARICQNLPTTAACANPATEFISGFIWNGGASMSVVCSPRKDAFVTFGDPTNYSYTVEPAWPTPTTVTTTTVLVTTTTGTVTTTTTGTVTTTTVPSATTTTGTTTTGTGTTTTTTSTTSTTTTTVPLPTVHAGCFVDTNAWDIVSIGNCDRDTGCTNTHKISFSVGTETSGADGDNWRFPNPSAYTVTCSGECYSATYTGSSANKTSTFHVVHNATGTTWDFTVHATASHIATGPVCTPIP